MYRSLQKIFRILGLKREDINLVFLSDRQIRRVNKRYLRHDRPTDVLAFGYGKKRSLRNSSGDILISLDTARRQAKKEGHSLLKELKVLMIHGLLHLIGYNDHRPRDRKRMWRKTETLLKKIETL